MAGGNYIGNLGDGYLRLRILEAWVLEKWLFLTKRCLENNAGGC
jgi:hypothetical protein